MLPLAKRHSMLDDVHSLESPCPDRTVLWLVVRSSSLWQIGLYRFGYGFLVYAESERLKLPVTDMNGFDHAYGLVLFIHLDLHDGFRLVVQFRADMTACVFVILVLMQDGMDVYLPVIGPLHEFEMISVDSPGELMSYIKSLMPSIMTSPKFGIVPMACSTIARRSLGENLRRASMSRLSGFLSSGNSAKRRIRFNICWQ